MFSLKAYFDDSGEKDQAVGGCVASAESWARFDDEWRAVLNRFHVDEFHAVRFENRTHRFKAMCESDRAPFRASLLEVLTRHVNPQTGGAYVCAVAIPEFVDQLKARMPIGASEPKRNKSRSELRVDKQVEAFSDPYCVCLGHSLRTVLELAIGGRDSVNVFVAHQPNRTEHIDWLYTWMLGVGRFREHLEGFQRGKKMQPKSILPLQAADFAAYYLSKRFRQPGNPVAWVADKLYPNFPVAVPFNSATVAGWAM